MTELATNPVFLRKTYDETRDLLVEARNYLALQCPAETKSMTPSARLLVSQESLRVTSRLTQAMAWLLAQRAVLSGEINLARALSEEFALSGQSVCLDERWSQEPCLPSTLQRLSQRSLDLYLRIERLERMLRQKVAS